ncbi:DUF4129 domain-containing protein [Salinadaptatus halalkaliphilus]|uniref:DUF4129 domain-containing protein n=1 Tax=Salinadaptatus halalkaliphilus TaxID=2419781 RepID=A0A4S3THG0_9EURY|nr:DUF4129 domain-containing protein [Salinadaptatus halalkaliphilus]THE63346.1 DUF4129 domain-containing protein [Salinadaptatus halalkaliphilus]
MSRRHQLGRALIALGGIVAVAIAAATLHSPVELGDSGDGSGLGTGDGDGVGSGVQPPPQEPTGGIQLPAFLEYLGYVLLSVLAIALVWYLLAHRRRAVKLIAVCLLATVLVAAIVEFLPPIADTQPLSPGPEGILGEGGSSGSDGTETTPISVSPLLIGLALIAAIFVGGVLFTRGRDGASAIDDDPDSPESVTTDSDVAAVATAAGNAADRLEDGTDVDNEVYRAWREMTALLSVDRPASTTPREFADAAVAAGLDHDDVEALTRLFEDARYGDLETTPEMERRASAVFRRIEAADADRDWQSKETTGRDDRGDRASTEDRVR